MTCAAARQAACTSAAHSRADWRRHLPPQQLSPTSHHPPSPQLTSLLRFPLALAVRRSGEWQPAARPGTAFYGLAGSADAYLRMRLPEATLLAAPADGSPLAAHSAAWAALMASAAPYAIVVEAGALLAKNLREVCSTLLREAGTVDARWRVIHLLAVTDEAATPPGLEASGALLRCAPPEGEGSPAYLVSRAGAASALAAAEGAAHGTAAEVYASLAAAGPSFATAQVAVLWGDVPSSSAPPPPAATSMSALVASLLRAGAFELPAAGDLEGGGGGRGAAGEPALCARLMAALDRAAFGGGAASVYEEKPLHLATANGSTMMSAPSAHARAAAALLPALRPGGAALDIGAGSGYMSAMFALALAEAGGAGSAGGGRVFALERDGPIAEHAVRTAQAALRKIGVANAASSVSAVVADGRAGHVAGAPYDAIYVGGSMREVPAALVAQLRPRGRLLLAVGPPDGTQRLTLVEAGPSGGVARRVVLATTVMQGIC